MMIENRIRNIVRECLLEALQRERVSDWNHELQQMAKNFCNAQIEGLPLIYGWDYLPQSSKKNANDLQKRTQEFIYCLKRDSNAFNNDQYQQVKSYAASFVVQQLTRCFGNNLDEITLVPVPTHDNQSNNRRWKELLSTICQRCPVQNGFGLFHYTGETVPSHFNKGHIGADKKGDWDSRSLSQKNVVLLDDLLTTGQTMEQAKEEIEKKGAIVVMGIVFAKTINN